ncbi:MAG: class I SAM-dependent methyltransferase [Steroidobacter sp.]
MNMAETNEKFTGEYFVPGAAGDRIEADHMARYHFARKYVLGRKVLDIACGYGYGANILMEAGALSYRGVDISEELVKNATEMYGSEKIVYECADACKYQTREKFDVIVSFETIEHIKTFRDALKVMRNCLAPDGVIIISSPNRPVSSPGARTIFDPPENRFHTQEFTVDELVTEMKVAGFRMSDAEVFGQRLSVLHFRNRLLRKVIRCLSLDPNGNASPEVRRFTMRKPRYFLIVAKDAG